MASCQLGKMLANCVAWEARRNWMRKMEGREDRAVVRKGKQKKPPDEGQLSFGN
jgi:hypothetical protein